MIDDLGQERYRAFLVLINQIRKFYNGNNNDECAFAWGSKDYRDRERILDMYLYMKKYLHVLGVQ